MSGTKDIDGVTPDSMSGFIPVNNTSVTHPDTLRSHPQASFFDVANRDTILHNSTSLQTFIRDHWQYLRRLTPRSTEVVIHEITEVLEEGSLLYTPANVQLRAEVFCSSLRQPDLQPHIHEIQQLYQKAGTLPNLFRHIHAVY